MKQHQYYVYIMASKPNGTLYIGVTNNLVRRVYEHKNGLISGFTKKYNVKLLVYFQIYEYVYHALQREKTLKHWLRDWKIKTIEEKNPHWEDLSATLGV
ncbi:MAG: GIY-YIG nuclease family protein [Alphaproteobacteria bacterium]|nr:GIY-YIG nuclease family protein [Alphaproteobacteria bacterium]